MHAACNCQLHANDWQQWHQPWGIQTTAADAMRAAPTFKQSRAGNPTVLYCFTSLKLFVVLPLLLPCVQTLHLMQ
jgi:hypothetical protein